MLMILAAAAAAATTAAAGQPADTHQVALTIYNDDLALVQEQRTLTLAPGRNRLEFKDVSASIRPETVALSAAGVSIVEQNFDYDLLTPAKLMEKAVGQQVQIVRTNPGTGQQVTETATVLSVNDGVVLRIGDRIEVLHDDSVPTRVIFPGVPEGLRAQPTLSVTVDAQGGGARPATLSYLTTGLSWSADYVALFDEKGGKLDLQGWVTLKNTSGSSFSNARTQLLSGAININRPQTTNDWRDAEATRRLQAQAGVEGGQKAPLLDYNLYPLAERTTIAQNQTKQVGFIDAHGVAARKIYQFRSENFESSSYQHADVVIALSNSAQSGLGAPLPAGVVRVYVRDTDGASKFVGEDSLSHTPQGSDVFVKVGQAFDITVQPTVDKDASGKKDSHVYTVRYEVKNARGEPVVVEVRQDGLWRNGTVLKESLPSSRLNANSLLWKVDVPANGSTTLQATINAGW